MKNVLLLLSTVLIFISCSTNNNGTVTVVPIAPTNLTGSVISTSQVNLSWTDNATNEDGYKIERKSGSGSYAVVGSMGVNLTTFGDLGLSPNTTYTYRVYAYNSAGNSLQYSNEVTVTTQDNIPSWLTNGLVAYYPFNGNAGDSSGNGNHGTVVGATLTTDRFGYSNNAYLFQNKTDYIDLTGKSIAGIGNSSRSIFTWIKTDDNTEYLRIIATGTSSPGQAFNILLMYNGVPVVMGYHPSDYLPNTGTHVTDNNWHLVGVTYDGVFLKTWVDGILQNSSNQFLTTGLNPGGSISFNTTGNNNFIGAPNEPGYLDTRFTGKQDDIRIYNRALSQSEVTYLATH